MLDLEKEYLKAVHRFSLQFKDSRLEKGYSKVRANQFPKWSKKLAKIIYVLLVVVTGFVGIVANIYTKQRLIMIAALFVAEVLDKITYKVKKLNILNGGFVIVAFGIVICEHSVLQNPDPSKGLYFGMG